MKALIICEKHSGVKFEDFTFDVNGSLFLHSHEINTLALSTADGKEDEKKWEKPSDIYDVHVNIVLYHELVERNILDNQSDFMQAFSFSELILNGEDVSEGIVLKYEITIF